MKRKFAVTAAMLAVLVFGDAIGPNAMAQSPKPKPTECPYLCEQQHSCDCRTLLAALTGCEGQKDNKTPQRGRIEISISIRLTAPTGQTKDKSTDAGPQEGKGRVQEISAPAKPCTSCCAEGEVPRLADVLYLCWHGLRNVLSNPPTKAPSGEHPGTVQTTAARHRLTDEFDSAEAQEIASQRTREALERRPPSATTRHIERIRQTQQIYSIAEECMRKGDWDKAYTCYHEVARMLPDSDYARLAARKIDRIELLRQLDGKVIDKPKDGFAWAETSAAEEAEHTESAQTIAQMLQILFPRTMIEFEVGKSHEGSLRMQGGVYFGPLGCQIEYRGGATKITWPPK